MRHWFTRADMELQTAVIKRFEPSHWTIDFPRGSMASVVSMPNEDKLRVDAVFATKGDLAGLIFDSEDKHVHVGHQRHTSRDYSKCTLKFRWKSSGIVPLDQINGPTLTIEGRDESGNARAWYVRLWNYAEGSPEDAEIIVPFDRLDSGYDLPGEADRVWPRDVDRMFISLVPIGYISDSKERFESAAAGQVSLSEIDCSGAGSVVTSSDTFVPEHSYRICTAYDDMYHLSPERVIDGIERLGYRKVINHYVGMSHFPTLGADGRVDEGAGICTPARAWHESFAALAASRGYSIIWSISMELLDQFCPEHWKQRAWDGAPAQTGYSPPSTLLSPAVEAAVAYLGDIAAEFVAIGVEAGLPAKVQIGEPWWWVRVDHAICMYDLSAASHFPSDHVPIKDVRTATSGEASDALDIAGRLLSSATTQIIASVRSKVGPLTSHVLTYLPSILRDDAPQLVRANIPLGWAYPAFDVLQLEDYEWATSGLVEQSRDGLLSVSERLAYPASKRHYLSGFVQNSGERSAWREILAAAARQREEQVSEVFLWALPQIFRDNLTIFEGEQEVDSFRDVSFPLAIGKSAWVEPAFSTSIATGASGFEFRNVNWEQARLRFDVGPGVRSLADLQSLLVFFRSMRGNAVAFRFRDPLDFSSAGLSDEPTSTDIDLGIGDGMSRRFALIKRYGEGEVRRISRPDAATIRVAVGGVNSTSWSLADAGFVEFSAPPAPGVIVTAGFHFDVPVRFEEDRIRLCHKTFLAGEVVSVPLIEVREA